MTHLDAAFFGCLEPGCSALHGMPRSLCAFGGHSSEGSMQARPFPRPHPHPVGRLCRQIGHLAIPSAVYWRQPLVDVPSPELCSLKFLLCFISPVGHFLFLFLVWFWIFFFLLLLLFFSFCFSCLRYQFGDALKVVPDFQLDLTLTRILRSPCPVWSAVREKGSHLCASLSPKQQATCPAPFPLLPHSKRFFSFVLQWWKHLHEVCVQSRCEKPRLLSAYGPDLIEISWWGSVTVISPRPPSLFQFPKELLHF